MTPQELAALRARRGPPQHFTLTVAQDTIGRLLSGQRPQMQREFDGWLLGSGRASGGSDFVSDVSIYLTTAGRFVVAVASYPESHETLSLEPHVLFCGDHSDLGDYSDLSDVRAYLEGVEQLVLAGGLEQLFSGLKEATAEALRRAAT